MNDEPDFVRTLFDRWMPIYAAGVVILCWAAGAALALGLIAGLVRRALFH
jgi:hypothetical protein